MIRNFRQIRAGTRSLSLVSQGENAYLCAHRPHPAVGYKDAAAMAAHGQSAASVAKMHREFRGDSQVTCPEKS
jgi:hypothetical protein